MPHFVSLIRFPQHLVRIAVLSFASAVAAFASIQVAVEPAGSQNPDSSINCSHQTCLVGVETFDQWTGGPLTTDYGTSNQIVGTYSGDLRSFSADRFGGAGGNGLYPELFAGSYTLDLATSTGVPGVNYFGLWLSALDIGNTIQLYNNSALLYTFTPDTLQGLVGSCSGANSFCGNPNSDFAGQVDYQQYAYLNFSDTNGYFNKVVFTETGWGGLETDNQAVGYLSSDRSFVFVTNATPTPEPGYLALSAIGFTVLAMVALRRRRFVLPD